MSSNMPVGVMMSGGLDSTAVACLAASDRPAAFDHPVICVR